MKTIEFVLERTVPAPIDEVFTRLADIEGHNDWMPRKGSIRRLSRLTSPPGETAVGTTYVDETVMGEMPGEVAELSAPTLLVYHWWDRTKGGRTKSEGWPGYTLQSTGDRETLVRHHARMNLHGASVLMAPLFRRVAVRERTTTVDALAASFQEATRETA